LFFCRCCKILFYFSYLTKDLIVNDTATETLDIMDLEYDVAGVGAEEPADSQTSYAAFVLYVTQDAK